MSATEGSDPDDSLEALVDAVLPAVRALVAVAVRALEASPVPITLPQFRMLVTLAEQGPQGSAALAATLGVEPSTVTRMGDRLVRDRLVARRSRITDRRTVEVGLTPLGRRAVEVVQGRRRESFGRLLEAVPPARRAGVVAALRDLGAAPVGLASPSPVIGCLA